MGETVVLQYYIGNDGGIHTLQTHSCSGWVLVLPRDRLELATAHSMSRSPGQPHAQAQPKCWREQRMVLTGCPVPNRPQIVKTWTSLLPFGSARGTGTTTGNWAATPMEYGSPTNTARFHQEHRLPSSTCWYLWGFPVGFRMFQVSLGMACDTHGPNAIRSGKSVSGRHTPPKQVREAMKFQPGTSTHPKNKWGQECQINRDGESNIMETTNQQCFFRQFRELPNTNTPEFWHETSWNHITLQVICISRLSLQNGNQKKEPLMNHDEPRDTRVGALEILQHEVP